MDLMEKKWAEQDIILQLKLSRTESNQKFQEQLKYETRFGKFQKVFLQMPDPLRFNDKFTHE